MMWVRDKEPNIYKNTRVVLQAKDYIAFRLTDKIATDYSDASSTLAYNICEHRWDEELIQTVGLDIEKLPPICDGTKILGEVTSGAARECGLSSGTPVVLGGGDGAMASMGVGLTEPGKGYACLGTSAWNGICSTEPVSDSKMRIVTWNHVIPELALVMGTMQSFGGSLSWMKNVFFPNTSFSEIDAMVMKSPPGANGLVFLPYLYGERSPYWNAQANGAYIGLTVKHTINDIARAVYEGIAFNMLIILDILRENSLSINTPMPFVGGAANNDVLLQIMSDMYGISICRPKSPEDSGSVGAAILAGTAVGLFSNLNVIHDFIRFEKVFQPQPSSADLYAVVLPTFEESYQALIPVFHKIGLDCFNG
jgi:xylulokinase